MPQAERVRQLTKIGKVIRKMADPDIFVWLERGDKPSKKEVERAATIVADRLCGAVTDPIIRNAQERRQLSAIGSWLRKNGYKSLPAGHKIKFNTMNPGTYSFRMNVPVKSLDALGQERFVNIPIDVVIMPHKAKASDLPLLIEAKSAGDFTNVNKRRKEEAAKNDLSFELLMDTLFGLVFFFAGTSTADTLDTKRLRELIGFGNIV